MDTENTANEKLDSGSNKDQEEKPNSGRVFSYK